MPCRALEAFGRTEARPGHPSSGTRVLMPCRALEAFGPRRLGITSRLAEMSLNALSGIGGVRTGRGPVRTAAPDERLNALSGIGGVRTNQYCPFCRKWKH